MKNKKDTYEKWEAAGELPKILDYIRDCARKLVTQKEMCQALHIREDVFCNLKKRHPEIQRVQDEARFDLKRDLAGALYKKALGYEIIEETQDIEDSGKGQKQKRKIHRVKKQIPPDYKSILYLLTKTFGREYCERYEELQLAEKKLEQAREEWNSENECSDEEDN